MRHSRKEGTAFKQLRTHRNLNPARLFLPVAASAILDVQKEKEGSSSFLKRRTKKLLLMAAAAMVLNVRVFGA